MRVCIGLTHKLLRHSDPNNNSFKKGINMKNIISVILILILFQSCAEESNRDTAIDLIKKVETGLTTPVYIEDDSTWSIAERMEHYGIPGVSIAVIHNGEIAWTKGYGVMDKESKAPVTEQTLFQAAATSMPVTAYGALRLVEQNKVGLDENINSYLKSWKLPDNEFTKYFALINSVNFRKWIFSIDFL